MAACIRATTLESCCCFLLDNWCHSCRRYVQRSAHCRFYRTCLVEFWSWEATKAFGCTSRNSFLSRSSFCFRARWFSYLAKQPVALDHCFLLTRDFTEYSTANADHCLLRSGSTNRYFAWGLRYLGCCRPCCGGSDWRCYLWDWTDESGLTHE